MRFAGCTVTDAQVLGCASAGRGAQEAWLAEQEGEFNIELKAHAATLNANGRWPCLSRRSRGASVVGGAARQGHFPKRQQGNPMA